MQGATLTDCQFIIFHMSILFMCGLSGFPVSFIEQKDMPLLPNWVDRQSRSIVPGVTPAQFLFILDQIAETAT